jgi:hypothetical protein
MYGYDEDTAYLVDTRPQGGAVKTPRENLELARKEKGPMSARNKSYTLSIESMDINYASLIPTAICRNAEEYLNPPIQNFGYKGILKTSDEIRKWLRTSKDPKADFGFTAVMMERAGTGGALFRNLYCDFLGEAHERLQLDPLQEAHEDFALIARMWAGVSNLFERVRCPDDTEIIEEASNTLVSIAKAEHKTMTMLREYFAKRQG